MSAAFFDLAEALRRRNDIISDQASRAEPERHIERLRKISDEIERLRLSLPKPIDPQLAHFLQRASYEKALEWLEGRLTRV